MLRFQVHHLRQHIVINTCCGSHIGLECCHCILPAFAEFHGCKHFAGGRGAHAFYIVDFIETSLAEVVQILVELVEEVLSDVNGGVLARSAANEDGEEFSVRERFHSIHLKFNTWAVFGCPLSDGQFHGSCRGCLYCCSCIHNLEF